MGVQTGSIGRRIGQILAGALAAGLAVGLASRVLMGAVAVAMENVIKFTVPGTLMILIVFIVFAIPAAATATASRIVRTAGRWVSTGIIGFMSVRNGITEAKTIVFISDDGLMPIAVFITAMAAVLVAYGHVAQHVVRRLANRPRETLVPLVKSAAVRR